MSGSDHGPAAKTPSREPAAGPLFIVSMWRAGSSLLYRLLNKHPDVALMYEADLVLLWPSFWKPRRFSDWAARWEFWNQSFSRHRLSPDRFAGIADFKTAFAAVHKEYARQKGAVIWGDKSPNYFNRLHLLAREFPGARFIIVWRNPTSIANSIVRAAQSGAPYFRRKGTKLRALLGYPVLKRECDRLLASGAAVLQLNYEDLIDDPAVAMQQVCGFLQIPYIGDLSNLAGADRSTLHAGEHHALLNSDRISTESRPEILDARWRGKIAQYGKLWHAQYAGAWPPCPGGAGEKVRLPSGFARGWDAIKYRLLQGIDRSRVLAFCILPLWLLNQYRVVKYGQRWVQLLRDSAAGSASQSVEAPR